MNKNKTTSFIILLLIFIFAIYARLYSYLQFRPLWHDECSLAINIINKNFFGYFGVLQHQQSAPPLFMMLTKLSTMCFGTKEFALRLIPILSSLLSIPVFFIFSKKFLTKKFSVLIANFLFAINYYVIYYGQEFKQYSTELFIFLFTFILLSKINFKKLSYKIVFFIGLFCSLIPIIALPSLFIICAFAIFQFLRYKTEILKKLLLFLLPIISSSIFLYIAVLLPSRSEFLMQYWNNGFLSLNLYKIINLIQLNLQYYFYPNNLILSVFILIILGFYILFKKHSKYNYILILTCLLIVIASALKLYPIMQRVSLYIIPILIILIIKPFDLLSLSKKTYSISIVFLIVIGLSAYNISYFKKLTSITSNNFDGRSAIKYFSDNYNHKDLTIINIASDSDFIYYSHYYNLKMKNYAFLQVPNNNKELYFNILNTLPKNQNIWFVYVYDYSHSPVIPILKEWAQNKKILNKYDKNGVYIVEISKSQ